MHVIVTSRLTLLDGQLIIGTRLSVHKENIYVRYGCICAFIKITRYGARGFGHVLHSATTCGEIRHVWWMDTFLSITYI